MSPHLWWSTSPFAYRATSPLTGTEMRIIELRVPSPQLLSWKRAEISFLPHSKTLEENLTALCHSAPVRGAGSAFPICPSCFCWLHPSPSLPVSHLSELSLLSLLLGSIPMALKSCLLTLAHASHHTSFSNTARFLSGYTNLSMPRLKPTKCVLWPSNYKDH